MVSLSLCAGQPSINYKVHYLNTNDHSLVYHIVHKYVFQTDQLFVFLWIGFVIFNCSVPVITWELG